MDVAANRTLESSSSSSGSDQPSAQTPIDRESYGQPSRAITPIGDGYTTLEDAVPRLVAQGVSADVLKLQEYTIPVGNLLPGAVEPTPKRWTFPWSLCRTWKGMQGLIIQAFADKPVESENAAKGAFELIAPDKSIIIPQVWETIARPGWTVTIKFHFPVYTATPAFLPPPPPGLEPADESSQDAASEASDDDSAKTSARKKSGPAYDRNVKHTVAVYHVSRYTNEKPTFEYERHFGRRIAALDPNKVGKTIPILQEVVRIYRKDQYNMHVPRASRGNAQGLKISSKGILLGRDDKFGKRSLQVNSPLLMNALRAVIRYSSATPSGNTDSLKNGNFPFPYVDLYHHRDDLIAYKTSHPARERHPEDENAECDSHIDVLVNYLDHQEEIGYNEAKKRWSKDRALVTFGSFWLIAKPGSDVYVREDGHLNAYVVESVIGGPKANKSTSSYKVQAWNLALIDGQLRRKMKTIEVPVFDGEREISSLPVYPVHFHRDHPTQQPLKERLVERGKKYFELIKAPAYREYTGKGLKAPRQDYDNARVVIYPEKGQVKTSHGDKPGTPGPGNDYEFAGYYSSSDDEEEDYFRSRPPPPPRPKIHPLFERPGTRARVPGCQCQNCKQYTSKSHMHTPLTYDSYDKIDLKEAEELLEHQYFICASHLNGFILKDRIYDWLDVQLIVEPMINVRAIEQLVMKTETNKNLLRAICERYNSDRGHKPFFTDFIRGKGEGQIILLHGPPGTGKTLTAESVAEHTKRPLLSITAADLGDSPEQLEQNLLTFFRDANEWGAIVLLDEADVYLERRSTQDLRRNSIVSIFLRAMDYFKGILFLTTNRVGSFDEAFMSRIHVQIGYDPLDDAAREQIWDNYFNKLGLDYEQGGREIRYEWAAKEYVKHSKEVRLLEWNGREIRNAFQTAVNLALDNARDGSVPKVMESHLRQVVRMAQSFKDYINATHDGKDASAMAYDSGLRDDTKRHS